MLYPFDHVDISPASNSTKSIIPQVGTAPTAPAICIFSSHDGQLRGFGEVPQPIQEYFALGKTDDWIPSSDFSLTFPFPAEYYGLGEATQYLGSPSCPYIGRRGDDDRYHHGVVSTCLAYFLQRYIRLGGGRHVSVSSGKVPKIQQFMLDSGLADAVHGGAPVDAIHVLTGQAAVQPNLLTFKTNQSMYPPTGLLCWLLLSNCKSEFYCM
eukprot:TRINITY_DN59684_c0_g1_i2.p1 TRINITY_DN59684_c0_g1~~TRINITY_DN59684_c0_g1_i2.p1  ORF type:complete len:210 (+),score=11.24 TRINITY_DN59684_c0_g1_i2:174-803(+)